MKSLLLFFTLSFSFTWSQILDQLLLFSSIDHCHQMFSVLIFSHISPHKFLLSDHLPTLTFTQRCHPLDVCLSHTELPFQVEDHMCITLAWTSSLFHNHPDQIFPEVFLRCQTFCQDPLTNWDESSIPSHEDNNQQEPLLSISSVTLTSRQHQIFPESICEDEFVESITTELESTATAEEFVANHGRQILNLGCSSPVELAVGVYQMTFDHPEQLVFLFSKISMVYSELYHVGCSLLFGF